MLTGERPEVNPEVAERLARLRPRRLRLLRRLGLRAGARARPAAAHQPRRALARRPRPAARGDRLAGADARVGQPRPGRPPGLADQAPGACAWRRSRRPASCGSRSPAGSWSGSARPRRSGSRRSRRSPRSTPRHGHLQEVILQNFVPHPRYYGREVAEIADEAARERWTRRRLAARRRASRCPTGRPTITLDDMKRLVAETPAADARRRHPDPAEPLATGGSTWSRPGATDLGGLSANGDHISPEHAFPSPHQVRKRLAPRGYALTERLCVYPQYLRARSGSSRASSTWSSSSTGASSRAAARAGARERAIDPELAPRGDRARPRRRAAQRGRAHRAVRRDAPRGDRGRCGSPPTSCAPSSPATTATFVVNRNINFTNVCIVGCAFCGFGQGKRSPDAYHVTAEDFQARIAEAVEFGATEICMQGGIHPDYTLEHYGALAAARQGGRAAAPPARLLADGDPLHVRALGPHARRRSSTTCSSAASARPRAPPPRCSTTASATRISPNKLPVGALGRDHRGLPPRRPALDLDRDVRPHRGALGARPPHARGPRAAGAHRRDHRVRAALLHPVPDAARAHPRDRGDLARAENLKHTAAFRLALGRTITNLQASWVKMGARRGDREPALGRQRPRRDADGGEHLAHGGLPARGPARARGPDRRGARAAGRTPGAAHDALRDRRDVLRHAMRAMVLERPGQPLARAPSCPTPSRAAARCSSRVDRLRRLPHRPAHRRRRAGASRSCRWSSATRSSARWSGRGTGRSASRPATGSGSRWLGWTCGECRYCRSGRENLCERALLHRLHASTAATPSWPSPTSASACRCPPAPAAEAAPLLCAGLIGYRALRMCGDAERLGLYGFGASAHIVCQVAAHQGRRVFAITRAGDAEKQRRSRASSAPSGPATADELPEPLDAAIIFAPVGRAGPGRAAGAGARAASSSAPAST